MAVYGIDLGTTDSRIAYVDDAGRPVVLKSVEGEDTTPSVVYFESPETVVVGRQAKNCAALVPDLVVELAKRQMGQDVRFSFHGQEYSPESIAALILRELARAAQEQTGEVVRDVVITVPAYFGLQEREATREAGQIAGLNVLDIFPEPVAAALAYQVLRPSSGVRHILVYDLGGGTFDTTVLRAEGDDVRIVCTDGDYRLGGADWDSAIVDFLLHGFTDQYPQLDPAGDEPFMQDLAISAEELKKALSAINVRKHNVVFDGRAVQLELTRTHLEELTSQLLEWTMEITGRTIASARERGVERFDDVLLVGGMTSMPIIARTLKERFGLDAMQQDPQLAVAKGAALFALMKRVPVNVPGDGDFGPASVAVQKVADRLGISVEQVEDLAAMRVTTVGGGVSPDMRGLPPVRRYLLGRFPDSVRPGRVFSVLVSVVRSVGAPPEGGAPLSPFDVPTGGRHLALILYAPGLRVVDDHRQTVLVPPSGDSEPVKFDLIGDDVGLRRISVTAWDGGSYLGELIMEISVERDGPARPDRTAIGEAREGRTEGEVTLLVRYDPHQMAYRFEFIDVDYPEEVTGQLVYDPGPAVERLVRRLGALAEGTAGYSAAATRAYLVNEGVTLWQELLPEQLRSQFWERQRRITQLTILTNHDVVPWELLYPKDRRHDAGFLVEQFPVTRAIYGHARQRRLQLHPARFVVPPGSPADAQAEAHALAGLLGTRLTTVSELMPLLQLISEGSFGLLHFACHNRFDPHDGSSIRLDSPFTPTFLAIAASDQTLTSAAPVVFINACRSIGEVPSYNQLDGWAEKFLHAGAAAFIGSLWDVCDGTAREFAQELYRRLVAGEPLGDAVMAARREVAAEPGDPTWLAYAVYGDPQARVDPAAKYEVTAEERL
jgi:molecular chaperone DnaK